MTLPGPIPSQPRTAMDRITQLERRIRAMQAAPKLSATRDGTLFGDAVSTAPRALVQNTGVTMTLSTPRAVLMYASVPTGMVSRCSFAVQNPSVSAATIACAVHTGTDPTALTLWGSGTASIAASVADDYDVPLSNVGVLPIGYVLISIQATAVGATVPSLCVTGQAPVDVYLGKDPNVGPIFTNVVGTTTMAPWPSPLSLSVLNTAVWTASQQLLWLALGS